MDGNFPLHNRFTNCGSGEQTGPFLKHSVGTELELDALSTAAGGSAAAEAGGGAPAGSFSASGASAGLAAPQATESASDTKSDRRATTRPMLGSYQETRSPRKARAAPHENRAGAFVSNHWQLENASPQDTDEKRGAARLA